MTPVNCHVLRPYFVFYSFIIVVTQPETENTALASRGWTGVFRHYVTLTAR